MLTYNRSLVLASQCLCGPAAASVAVPDLFLPIAYTSCRYVLLGEGSAPCFLKFEETKIIAPSQGKRRRTPRVALDGSS